MHMVVISENALGMEEGSHVFELSGGRLCLDFANTVGNHAGTSPNEHLNSYADLVSWGCQAGTLTYEEAEHLLQQAAQSPQEAHAVLTRAITLREAIYRIFSQIAAGQPPPHEDLDLLNAALSEVLPHLRIVWANGRFTWGWAGEHNALDRMLWPVIRDAAELLNSEDLSRVRECANDTCGWLFIDRSKNHSRRWCDMKTCGNQAKARRHYEKIRKTRLSRSRSS